MCYSLADSFHTVVAFVTDGFDLFKFVLDFDFLHVVKPCVEAYFEPHLRQEGIHSVLVAFEPYFIKEFLL